MNSRMTDAPWQQFKIQLRKTWSELTDEDLETISRDGNELVRVVLKRYGSEPDAATTPLRLAERSIQADRGRSAVTRLRICAGT